MMMMVDIVVVVVESRGIELRLFSHFSFLFHASILEPNLNLTFVERDHTGDFHSSLPS